MYPNNIPFSTIHTINQMIDTTRARNDRGDISPYLIQEEHERTKKLLKKVSKNYGTISNSPISNINTLDLINKP